jgi:hypothetical protein
MTNLRGAVARRLTVATVATATLVAPIVATASAAVATPSAAATSATVAVGTVKAAVSLNSPTSGTYGTTIQLTGTAWRYGTTTKLSGATIWLQRATHGKTNWASVTKTSATSAGTFAFNVVQTAAYDYRTFYGGSPTYTAAWSPVRYPAVLQKVLFDSIKDTNWTLGTLQATGRVYPTPPSGTQVWLQRYDATNKVWKNYISGRTTGSNSVVIKGNVGGNVGTYRLYSPFRSTFGAGYSTSTSFTHLKWRGAFRSAPTPGGTTGANYYVYNATESPSRDEAEVTTAVGGKVWLDVTTSGCRKVQFFAANFTDQPELARTTESVQVFNVATNATLRGPYALTPGNTVNYAFDLSNVAKTRFETHDDATADGKPYAYYGINILCAN